MLNAISIALADVTIGQRGTPFPRFGGSYLDKKVGFGHTNMPAGVHVILSPHFRTGKFKPSINASNHAAAHPTGEAMSRHTVCGGYREGHR